MIKITDEMVEIAARAIYEESPLRIGGVNFSWDSERILQHPKIQDQSRKEARAALEAVIMEKVTELERLLVKARAALEFVCDEWCFERNIINEALDEIRRATQEDGR